MSKVSHKSYYTYIVQFNCLAIVKCPLILVLGFKDKCITAYMPQKNRSLRDETSTGVFHRRLRCETSRGDFNITMKLIKYTFKKFIKCTLLLLITIRTCIHISLRYYSSRISRIIQDEVSEEEKEYRYFSKCSTIEEN